MLYLFYTKNSKGESTMDYETLYKQLLNDVCLVEKDIQRQIDGVLSRNELRYSRMLMESDLEKHHDTKQETK